LATPPGSIELGTVVTPDLMLFGVEGLRVVDPSIIPQIPSCNLNAISMAIGEKGAELIPAGQELTSARLPPHFAGR
jgi:choline dehydrogenase-like flavoprotein